MSRIFATGRTISLAAGLILVIFAAAAADTAQPGWGIIGPGGGGSMFFPTVSPHDPSVVLIACDMTGAYITNNAGKSWREFNLRNRVDSFAFDPTNPRVIYAGASGVFRSEDSGTSWRLVLPEPARGVVEQMVGDHADQSFRNPGWPGGKVESIRVDPDKGSRVLAAVVSDRVHVFLSENSAKTWTKLVEVPDAKAHALFLDPATPPEDRVMYLVTDSSVYRIRLGQPEPEQLAIPASIRSIVHGAAGFDNRSRRTFLYLLSPAQWRGGQLHTGVFSSRDGGKTWDELAGGLEQNVTNGDARSLPRFNFIGVSEKHAGTAYLGVVRHPEKVNGKIEDFFGIMKTEDSGNSWRWVVRASDRASASNRTKGWLERNYDAGWVGSPHGIGVSPTNPDVAYATDYGTAFYTVDGGKSWKQVYCNDQPDGSVSTGGLDVTTCYGIHFDPFDRDHLAISYTDIGFFHSFNGGKSWTQALKGVPEEWINTCYWLVFDPEVKGRAWSVWANAHDLPRPKMFRGNFDRFLGGVCRSEDSCRTWVRTTAGMPDNTVSTHIVLDPRSPRDSRTLYVAAFGKGVFKSTNGGAAWTPASDGLGTNRNAWRLVLLPDGTLYLLVARGLKNGQVIDGALYRSSNSAGSWEKVALPPGVNAPNDLVFDPANPSRMYLACWPYPIDGTERHGGVYFTEDQGASWRSVFNENAHVYGVAIDPSRPGRLFINTFDSAAYRSDNGGQSWRRLEGYNFKWGHHVVLDPHNPEMLYLTTFGSSVWHGPVDGVPGAFEDVAPFQGPDTSQTGRVFFFDDFDSPQLDASKWNAGLHQWGRDNNGVVPENVRLKKIEDEGKQITVLETEAHGDLYKGPVKGVRRVRPAAGADSHEPARYERTEGGTRVGGLVITREKYGPGRYEVRMKNLPLSGGCSCIWNYLETKDDYTEIDIEMPANGKAKEPNWANWAGLNTYYPGPEHINEKVFDLGTPQNDGRFHVYRWDWYDGAHGEPRVEFYLDGRLLFTSTKNIPKSPAQLWVGNWPAFWSGDFQYDTQHLYVDWVRITELR